MTRRVFKLLGPSMLLGLLVLTLLPLSALAFNPDNNLSTEVTGGGSFNCSDRSHGGDHDCGWVPFWLPGDRDNYQLYAADLTITQTHIETGLFLEDPTMRVDVCISPSAAPGGDWNCWTVWNTYEGVPGKGWFGNPWSTSVGYPPGEMKQTRYALVHVWVNNADLTIDVTTHGRRAHVDSFNASGDQVCWSTTNAWGGVSILDPSGNQIGGGESGCAARTTSGTYTANAIGPMGTVVDQAYFNGVGQSPPPPPPGGQLKYRCSGANTCIYEPDPRYAEYSSSDCNNACGGGQPPPPPPPGGGATQCNPPQWDGWKLDACWDVNGRAGGEDCSDAGHQRAADWWCSQGPACSGIGATNYSTAWTPNVGTKYASTARICPSCSFQFIGITCGVPAPSTPTISNLPACSNDPYQATISWTGQPDPSSGFYVDISQNSNFSSFYNKNTLVSTQTDTTNFKGLVPQQDQTLVLQPNTTYYTRVYNGSHSPTASWSVPSCRHNVCQVVNNAALCASVSGTGADECATNADCPPPPPLCDFSINPARVTVPATSTLAWSCTNANPQGCGIDQGVGSNLAPSGSETVNPTSSITYTLTCTGPSGTTSATASVRAFKLEGGALKEIPPQ